MAEPADAVLDIVAVVTSSVYSAFNSLRPSRALEKRNPLPWTNHRRLRFHGVGASLYSAGALRRPREYSRPNRLTRACTQGNESVEPMPAGLKMWSRT